MKARDFVFGRRARRDPADDDPLKICRRGGGGGVGCVAAVRADTDAGRHKGQFRHSAVDFWHPPA